MLNLQRTTGRSRRLGSALPLAALLLMLVGCGPSAGTPDQAAEGFFTALSAGDYDSAHSLLAPASQEALSRELDQLSRGEDAAEAVARLNAQLGTKLTQGELASMGSRGFFAIAMQSAVAQDPALKGLLAVPPKVMPAGLDPSGSHADVEVRFEGGQSRVVRCERLGGGWRVRFGRTQE